MRDKCGESNMMATIFFIYLVIDIFHMINNKNATFMAKYKNKGIKESELNTY